MALDSRWLALLPAPYLACSSGIAQDYDRLRELMVREQIEARGIANLRVLEAMRKVKRHDFVPASLREQAYEDHPLPIGEGQTISQPYIVAYMTEIVDPQPDDVVLEVGTGSGYQAAVLGELVRRVYTIEILPKLAQEAGDRLAQLGYRNIESRVGDGYLGWEEHAPYDAILVTAAADHVPEPLLDQLKPGGVMVIPVGEVWAIQKLMRIEKSADGETAVKTLLDVRFVPLTRRN